VVSSSGGGLFDTRPTTQTESGAFVFLGQISPEPRVTRFPSAAVPPSIS